MGLERHGIPFCVADQQRQRNVGYAKLEINHADMPYILYDFMIYTEMLIPS